MQEKIKKVAKKSIRFFVYMAAGVFFSAFSFVVSGMASYDYLLQDEMTTELVLVMLLYFWSRYFFRICCTISAISAGEFHFLG